MVVRGWKVFAVFMVAMVVIGEVPKLALLHTLSLSHIAQVAMDLLATLGLVGYSWGRQLLPPAFWRVFAPTFCILTAGLLGAAVTPIAMIVYLTAGSAMGLLGIMLAAAPVVAMALYTCIALLRYAALVGPGRHPLGGVVTDTPQLSLPLGER